MKTIILGFFAIALSLGFIDKDSAYSPETYAVKTTLTTAVNTTDIASLEIHKLNTLINTKHKQPYVIILQD